MYEMNIAKWFKVLLNFLLAPSVIVYDNACNLHTYCLNRHPTYFRNTRFLVDRLHWRDHTGTVLNNYLMVSVFGWPRVEHVTSGGDV